MSRHEDTVSLRQMLDHIEETVALAQGLGRDRETDGGSARHVCATEHPPE